MLNRVRIWVSGVLSLAVALMFGSAAFATDPTLLDTVVTSAAIETNITAATTKLATIVALCMLAWFGFYVVRSAKSWVRGNK